MRRAPRQKIKEYHDYVNFSDLLVQTGEPFYHRRRWVPRWLWRLMADEVISPLHISEELRKADAQFMKGIKQNFADGQKIVGTLRRKVKCGRDHHRRS